MEAKIGKGRGHGGVPHFLHNNLFFRSLRQILPFLMKKAASSLFSMVFEMVRWAMPGSVQS
jgi:hypothetical protein